MQESPQVYISASRDDMRVGSRIRQHLNDSGITLLPDAENIENSEHWLDTTEKAIRDSDLMLVLVSEATLDSQFMEVEYKFARKKGIAIIAVLTEKVQLPSWLTDLQAIDFREERDFDLLVDTVKQSLVENENVHVDLNKGSLPTQNNHRITRTLSLPDISWIKIPAGDFIYGEEQTQENRNLDAFYISEYLITNRQYQCFVDAGGYEHERWWQDLERQDYKESEWSQNNRPKTDVSWYEAVAFTRWLGDRFGFEVSLPTEEQWEKAARGTDGRVYPWGNEYRSGYANVLEEENPDNNGDGNLGETTAVGVYPNGKSSFGIEDICGNVQEWCSNKSVHNEVLSTYPSFSGDERVLRGGTCLDNSEAARTDKSDFFVQNFRCEDLGFRLVCVLPSIEYYIAGH